MIYGLLLAVCFAVLNRLRGWGPVEDWHRRHRHLMAQDAPLALKLAKVLTSKGVTSFASGLCAAAITAVPGYSWFDVAAVGAIVFIGLWLWAGPGHGKYFSSFHGRDDKQEKEIGWIDWLGYEIWPWHSRYDTRCNYPRGTFCMALRGLFLCPVFIGLSFVAWEHSWLFCLPTALQGFIYAAMRWVPEENAIPLAEIIWGALIGTAIATCIMWGAV